jgi:hypothetical protein
MSTGVTPFVGKMLVLAEALAAYLYSIPIFSPNVLVLMPSRE